jgi:hypothetical protein
VRRRAEAGAGVKFARSERKEAGKFRRLINARRQRGDGRASELKGQSARRAKPRRNGRAGKGRKKDEPS